MYKRMPENLITQQCAERKFILGRVLLHPAQVYRDVGQWLSRVLWEHDIVGSSPTVPTGSECRGSREARADLCMLLVGWNTGARANMHRTVGALTALDCEATPVTDTACRLSGPDASLFTPGLSRSSSVLGHRCSWLTCLPSKQEKRVRLPRVPLVPGRN
jgi:hypothetical protein